MIMPNISIIGVFKVLNYACTEAFDNTYKGILQSLDQLLSLTNKYKPLLSFKSLPWHILTIPVMMMTISAVTLA